MYKKRHKREERNNPTETTNVGNFRTTPVSRKLMRTGANKNNPKKNRNAEIIE